ncbi:Nif3-like dinuclear metal center hexameric protein [Candidatus Contubernalis alkaliaceticus]|uniref:Nif3-like dinuclear metal center hexameric protein n=1 Tax=Candidatus Contubernalis alkaliaceticus TaxID=338645 RepID=UPI001F4C30FE|nr:Nif3-like dinuclear metal center hexameric protein [Candidatus Contubernalis alkalaceticus]UNC92982.1 Nif3-like dinuclear metal center hexameric protein [Candidatus Contubernalis alkalaceticus]
MHIKTLTKYLEELAPPFLALEGDPTGLQIGSLKAEAANVLIALDFNREVMEEALELGANLVVTHHPIIFRPLKAVEPDSPAGSLICDAVKKDLTVYSAHTNLDVTEQGVSRRLAERLSLKNQKVLKPTYYQKLYKIVVFVPKGYENGVREALAEAKAGWIGNYSHCTFNLEGVGTFKPLEGTNPFIGQQGKIETVSEFRLETIVAEENLNKALSSMIKAHPYEEAAYDVYSLKNKGKVMGLGIVGEPTQELSLAELATEVKERLQVKELRLAGPREKIIKKVAVCGGSGGGMIEQAASRGADLLITGDISYHQFQKALSMNIALIDAGHDATERVVVPFLADYLRDRVEKGGHTNKIFVSGVETNPWSIM